MSAHKPLKLTAPQVNVSVIGEGFGDVDSSFPRCRFGTVDSTWAIVINDTNIVCLTPENMSLMGRVGVAVSVNGGVDWSHVNATFIFTIQPHVDVVSPASGWLTGGTEITIVGTGFVDSGALACRFGSDMMTRGFFLSDTMINCTTPAQKASEIMLLEVTNDAALGVWSPETVADGSSFFYQSIPRIHSLLPPVGTLRGGSRVTVVGTHLVPGTICKFGGYSSPYSVYISPFELVCITPASKVRGNVTVEVSNAFANIWTDSAIQFGYILDPIITSISPKFGTVTGGSDVTVFGENLDQSPASFCRFGELSSESDANGDGLREIFIVHAILESRTIIRCPSPRHAPGPVRVYVTLNNQEFFTASPDVNYTFIPNPVVTSVSPNNMSIAGNEIVTVRGKDFSEIAALHGVMRCQFGSVLVPVNRFINKTEVECVAPPHQAGDVFVEISQNGRDYVVNASSRLDFDPFGAKFVYHRINLTDMFPKRGPSVGNTKVVVLGKSFPLSSRVLCRFGQALPVPATVLDTEHLMCHTPQHPATITQLRIVLPGMSDASTPLGFEFQMPPQVHHLTRLAICEVGIGGSDLNGQATGCMTPRNILDFNGNAADPYLRVPTSGNVTVLVSGLNFAARSAIAGELVCRFDTVVVPTVYFNSTNIACIAPPHFAGHVPVEVSNNFIDFSSNNVLLEYVPMSLHEIVPVFGPDSGSTEVMVYGELFPERADIYCKFGFQNSTLARWVAQDRISCRTPAHPPTETAVNLTVFVPEIDIAVLQEAYTFYNATNITHVHPQEQFDQSELLTWVSGVRFTNSSFLECNVLGAKTEGIFINSTLMVCPTPARPTNLELDKPANALPPISDQLPVYHHRCPYGSICHQGHIVPCPKGAFCTGSGNATRCPPGTYQSLTGQDDCLSCPRGYICPESGTVVPLICPAGFVCDSERLVLPETLCPAGHYCRKGTATADPSSRVYAFNRPLVCGEGVYCGPGVVSPVTIIGNLSTPQPCSDGFNCRRGSDNIRGSGPCPTGHYCPKNADGPIPCPPRHYCPNAGNIFPTLCPPGTFNDQRGLNRCIECQPGFFCPDFGLNAPETCGVGKVCSKPRLASPDALCPPGHYCEVGTITVDFTDFSTELRPLPCWPRSFCLTGVESPYQRSPLNVTLFTRPQYCAAGFYCQYAANSSEGTGQCFEGHYCPVNSSWPLETMPGYFSQGVGNADQTRCAPGTFSNHWQTRRCHVCPLGKQCSQSGTVVPTDCNAGQYRDNNVFSPDIPCINCPAGSWGFTEGTKEAKNCIPCPPGRMCKRPGATNIIDETMYQATLGEKYQTYATSFHDWICPTEETEACQFIESCESGVYCRWRNAGPQNALKCPSGYACEQNTVPLDFTFNSWSISSEYLQMKTIYEDSHLAGSTYSCVTTIELGQGTGGDQRWNLLSCNQKSNGAPHSTFRDVRPEILLDLFKFTPPRFDKTMTIVKTEEWVGCQDRNATRTNWFLPQLTTECNGRSECTVKIEFESLFEDDPNNVPSVECFESDPLHIHIEYECWTGNITDDAITKHSYVYVGVSEATPQSSDYPECCTATSLRGTKCVAGDFNMTLDSTVPFYNRCGTGIECYVCKQALRLYCDPPTVHDYFDCPEQSFNSIQVGVSAITSDIVYTQPDSCICDGIEGSLNCDTKAEEFVGVCLDNYIDSVGEIDPWFCVEQYVTVLNRTVNLDIVDGNDYKNPEHQTGVLLESYLSAQSAMMHPAFCPSGFQCAEGTEYSKRQEATCATHHFCPRGSSDRTQFFCPRATECAAAGCKYETDCSIQPNMISSLLSLDFVMTPNRTSDWQSNTLTSYDTKTLNDKIFSRCHPYINGSWVYNDVDED